VGEAPTFEGEEDARTEIHVRPSVDPRRASVNRSVEIV
jgi:hypothetical protein